MRGLALFGDGARALVRSSAASRTVARTARGRFDPPAPRRARWPCSFSSWPSSNRKRRAARRNHGTGRFRVDDVENTSQTTPILGRAQNRSGAAVLSSPAAVPMGGKRFADPRGGPSRLLLAGAGLNRPPVLKPVEKSSVSPRGNSPNSCARLNLERPVSPGSKGCARARATKRPWGASTPRRCRARRSKKLEPPWAWVAAIRQGDGHARRKLFMETGRPSRGLVQHLLPLGGWQKADFFSRIGQQGKKVCHAQRGG